jgi:hypothetical protein
VTGQISRRVSRPDQPESLSAKTVGQTPVSQELVNRNCPRRKRSAVCAVITLVATALMTDYTGKDISGKYQSR